MKILVVEDDKSINSFISRGLKESGYFVDSVYDGESALEYFSAPTEPDLVILDLMLPKISGLEVLSTIRKQNSPVPIIILSAKRTTEEKVNGLQKGADDYMEKPFSFSELEARIQVLLRRGAPLKELVTSLKFNDLTLDQISRKVTRAEETIELQPKEFSLLEYFLKNKERVITKTMILENVYGYNFDTQTNVVDVLVYRLRNKIDKGHETKIIHTIRGLGYVLKT